MKRLVLALIIFGLLASPVLGQVFETTLYRLDQKADGTYQLTPVLISVRPALEIPPPEPGPQIPIVDAAKAALVAVPEYKDRAMHVKAIAFALNMIAPQLATSPLTVAENRKTVSDFVAQVVQGDAGKWALFWATLKPHLDAATTNAQLSAAYVAIQGVLADTVPDSGNEVYGVYPTYGLQGANPEFWKFILEVLLPLILKIIAGV